MAFAVRGVRFAVAVRGRRALAMRLLARRRGGVTATSFVMMLWFLTGTMRRLAVAAGLSVRRRLSAAFAVWTGAVWTGVVRARFRAAVGVTLTAMLFGVRRTRRVAVAATCPIRCRT